MAKSFNFHFVSLPFFFCHLYPHGDLAFFCYDFRLVIANFTVVEPKWCRISTEFHFFVFCDVALSVYCVFEILFFPRMVHISGALFFTFFGK